MSQKRIAHALKCTSLNGHRFHAVSFTLLNNFTVPSLQGEIHRQLRFLSVRKHLLQDLSAIILILLFTMTTSFFSIISDSLSVS